MVYINEKGGCCRCHGLTDRENNQLCQQSLPTTSLMTGQERLNSATSSHRVDSFCRTMERIKGTSPLVQRNVRSGTVALAVCGPLTLFPIFNGICPSTLPVKILGESFPNQPGCLNLRSRRRIWLPEPHFPCVKLHKFQVHQHERHLAFCLSQLAKPCC